MVTVHPTLEHEQLWFLCKALGNPVRLSILRFIHRHPGCIGNEILLHLPDDCARAQSTLSQHIKVLRDAELIETESEGPATAYRINEERLAWLCEQLGELRD